MELMAVLGGSDRHRKKWQLTCGNVPIVCGQTDMWAHGLSTNSCLVRTPPLCVPTKIYSKKTLFWQRRETTAAAIHISTSPPLTHPSLTVPLCAAAFSRPPSSPVSSSRYILTHGASIHHRSIAGGTQVSTSPLLDGIAERFEFKH